MKIFIFLLIMSQELLAGDQLPLVQERTIYEVQRGEYYERFSFSVEEYEGKRLYMNHFVNDAQKNRLRYTLNIPEVRRAFRESELEFEVIHIVNEGGQDFPVNQVLGDFLFLTPGVSPLLLSDILAGPQHFLSADYLLDLKIKEVEELNSELQEKVESAQSKEEIYDALTDYYDRFPSSEKSLDLYEFRERVAIVLADESLSSLKGLTPSSSNRSFGFFSRTWVDSASNPLAGLLLPVAFLLDVALAPTLILVDAFRALTNY